MAFQIDLPVLILRESGVVADGILERGSSAFYLPTFDLDSSAQSYLFSEEWQQIYHKWSGQVKELAKTRKIATTTNELPRTWNFLRKDATSKERDPIITRKTEDNQDRSFGWALSEDRERNEIIIRRDEGCDEGCDDDVLFGGGRDDDVDAAQLQEAQLNQLLAMQMEANQRNGLGTNTQALNKAGQPRLTIDPGLGGTLDRRSGSRSS